MRKTKKFSEGGRAAARRDRRMVDIESDYKKALARGVSEKEARAKRAQRIADTQDDYAKHTGADRTQTRAAEKAAESRLSAARRSPDKDMKPVSVASEGPATKKIDTTQMAQTPKVGSGGGSGRQTFSQAFAAARKGGAKTFTWNGKSYTTALRGEGSSPKPARSAPRPAATSSKPAASAPATVSEFLGRRLAPGPSRTLAEQQRDWESRGKKRSGYAKGGKIDGVAIRGKTRLKRKK